jgi:hypothetical protein
MCAATRKSTLHSETRHAPSWAARRSLKVDWREESVDPALTTAAYLLRAARDPTRSRPRALIRHQTRFLESGEILGAAGEVGILVNICNPASAWSRRGSTGHATGRSELLVGKDALVGRSVEVDCLWRSAVGEDHSWALRDSLDQLLHDAEHIC